MVQATPDEARPGADPRLDHDQHPVRPDTARRLAQEALGVGDVMQDLRHRDRAQARRAKGDLPSVQHYGKPGDADHVGLDRTVEKLLEEARARAQFEDRTVSLGK